MSRTSTVVWSLVLGVIAILGVLGLIYGPKLYREGKAVVGPIVELTKAERALSALNDEYPFVEPPDGRVGEARLGDFLEIRRELLPKYRMWEEMIRRVEGQNTEDWQTAKEIIAGTHDVMGTQVELLGGHRMSPVEFIWIEDLVYRTWFVAVADAAEKTTLNAALRTTASSDIEYLDDLERRFGVSRATRELRSRLEERAATLKDLARPVVEGVTVSDSGLFWARREEIAELDFEGYDDLHRAIGGSARVEITIDED